VRLEGFQVSDRQLIRPPNRAGPVVAGDDQVGIGDVDGDGPAGVDPADGD
jgi:hypothetical protein